VNGCTGPLYYTGGCWHGVIPSAWYNEFSGFLSIFLPPLLTLAGVAALWWWHHQCGVHHCYWPSRRLTAANERTCWRHAPNRKRTVQDIHEAHHAVLRLRHGHQETAGDG
jgi:hypothetical protein